MRKSRCFWVVTAFVLAASSFVLPSFAFAWGSEGHRIAAEIAEQYLEPAAARQVRTLLVLENATTLAEVSTWADEIRQQRPETARWHFVDIPIHPPVGTPAAYDAARDCPRGDCVVAAIERFAAVLGDKDAAPRRRLEALKWLVHLVADIHQPLHCADDGDRGGNDISVVWHRRLTTLHGLWDSGVLAAAGIGDARTYALELARSITPAEVDAWRGGTPADWANDSYDIASRLIYGEWLHGPGALPGDYGAMALPVRERAAREGGGAAGGGAQRGAQVAAPDGPDEACALAG